MHSNYIQKIYWLSATTIALSFCFQSDSTPLKSFFAEGFAVVSEPNARSIDRIVYGTAALSSAEEPKDLLDAAYDKGFRRFDLAHSYGAGESERIFGEWLEERGIDRNDVDIITKGGMGNDKYGDPNRPLLTRDGLRKEVQDSLTALRIDTVDMYMYHRDDPRLPVQIFVEWANELIDEGKVLEWGVSNWSFERFQEAYYYALENGYEPPRANSPQFSLAIPKCEVWPTTQSISGPENAAHIEWYNQNGVELLCWEVLAKGFMAKESLWCEHEVNPSSFDEEVEVGTPEWRVQRIQKAYCNPENWRRRRVASHLAKSFGGKLSQIAMLYPLTMGPHVSVIFGSTKTDHLEDMVSLQHMYLDDEAMSILTGREFSENLEEKEEEKRQQILAPPVPTANNIIGFSTGKSRAFRDKKPFNFGRALGEVEVENKVPIQERFRLYSFLSNDNKNSSSIS